MSPLLANLFLHYAFDQWMKKHYADIPFERYADDIVIHCPDQATAQDLLNQIRLRLKACQLDLNEEKTRVVYCKDCQRRSTHAQTKFTFLGYEFRPRLSRSLRGHFYVGFSAGISPAAKKQIGQRMRSWRLHKWVRGTIEEIATQINPILRGWINYYGHYNRHLLYGVFSRLDYRLIRWCMGKYKGIGKKKAVQWWKRLKENNKKLFAHWQLSV